MEASQNGHTEVVDTLLQHGASVDLQKEVNLLAIMYNRCFLLCLSSCNTSLCNLDIHSCPRGVEEVHNPSISTPPPLPPAYP